MSRIQDFGIEVKWPDGVEPEEIDVGNIQIDAGGVVLSRLVENETGYARDFVRASAVAMATWFIDNWWRLRYEPFPRTLVPSSDWRMRHELTAISGGTRWPPLMIYGTGQRVVIAPRSGVVEDVHGLVRYLHPLVASVQGEKYDLEIDRFLSLVADKCLSATGGCILNDLVAELKRERSDSEFSAWRKLEAELGYDPDTIPSEIMTIFAKLQKRVGLSGVTEAAVAAPGEQSAETLNTMLSYVTNSTYHINRSSTLDLLNLEDEHYSGILPWERAQVIASELRRSLGFVGPIGNESFANVFSQTWETVKNMKSMRDREKVPYGAVSIGKNNKDRIILKGSNRAESRRFELARALGDAAWERGAQLSVISDAKSDRQKFQRAFAGNFLCPPNDLIAYIDAEAPSESDIIHAANHFHVSTQVVKTTLMNKGLLPREALMDKLEAA